MNWMKLISKTNKVHNRKVHLPTNKRNGNGKNIENIKAFIWMLSATNINSILVTSEQNWFCQEYIKINECKVIKSQYKKPHS